MTIYSETKECYTGLPYKFRCRVFGKYDDETVAHAPAYVNKEYDDLTDYDGLSYVKETKKKINATRYGSPTVSGYEVSGFTASKYLCCTDNTISFTSPWEMIVKFTTASSVSGASNIIACYVDTKGIRFGWNSSKIIYFSIGNGSWINTTNNVGSLTVQNNTTYWYKIGWDGTNYYGQYSLDGETYVNDISYASTATPVYDTYPFLIGKNGASSSYPMQGSIDLDACELKTQSPYFPDQWTTVWRGTVSECTVLDFSNTRLPWAWGYQKILKNNRYVVASKNDVISYYGNVLSGTVAGTPTISPDRKMSGFSSSNYLTMLSQWKPNGNPWKIHLKITTGANESSNKYILGQPTTNYSTPQLMIVNKTLKVYLSSNKSSWDIASGSTCSIDLEPNTSYEIDFEFTGEAYKVSVDGVVGLSITTSTADYSGTYPIILGYDSGNGAFNGAVDLGESYIKFGDVEVWRGFTKETLQGCISGDSDSGGSYYCYAINGDDHVELVKETGSVINASSTTPRYLGEVSVYNIGHSGGYNPQIPV